MESSTAFLQQRSIKHLVTTTRTTEFKLIALGAVALAASVLILFSGWEISGESWAYWMWARVFAEDGTFVVSGGVPPPKVFSFSKAPLSDYRRPF